MKINEFMREVNKVACATYDSRSDIIKIYISEAWINDNEWFLVLFPHYKKIVSAYDWDALDNDLTSEKLQRIFELIQELEDTPVEERFPEKKYWLVWQEDDDDIEPWVLGYKKNSCGREIWEIDGEDSLKHDDYQTRFTNDDLKRIADDDKKMLNRLNAVKEPVEDDE